MIASDPLRTGHAQCDRMADAGHLHAHQARDRRRDRL